MLRIHPSTQSHPSSCYEVSETTAGSRIRCTFVRDPSLIAVGVMLRTMERQVTLRVIVESPPGDVDFGVQEGHGNDYKTVQKQRYTKQDLRFEFLIRVNEGKNGQPNFLGSFAQGPANNRFIYLDIGTYAGQSNTPWGRRLKIPLAGITWPMIEQASDASRVIEVRVPGTGRDGGPTCGTVKQFSGWMLSDE